MKAKKLFLLFVAVSVLSLSGCKGAGNENGIQEDTKDVQSEETVEESQTEESADVNQEAKNDNEAEDKQESTELSPISVMVESRYETQKHPKEEYFDEASVTYALYSLAGEDAQNYPKLNDALIALGKEQEANSKKSLQDLKEAYELDQEGNDNIDFAYYFEDKVEGKILRADSVILSIEESSYYFSGGAHGIYGNLGINFDAQTGEKLTISQIVKDTDALLALVKKKLTENYPEVQFDDLDEKLKAETVKDLNFAVTADGIKIYFNPYELASYADGEQQITVTFAENAELFEDRYTKTPANYVTPIDTTYPVSLDLNQDGQLETLQIVEKSDEYDMLSWEVQLGDQTWKDENDYGFNVDPYLVCNENHYYVYLFEGKENDYAYLQVVDLQTMKAVDTENENANLRPHSVWQNECAVKYALTNPNAMVLETRMQAMSTYSGVKTYYVGENGWPYTEDGLYEADCRYALTPKQDIKCQIVDQNGVVLEEDAKMPKDQLFQIVRTDGQNVIDFIEASNDNVTLEGEGEYQWKVLKDISVDLTGKTIYRIVTTYDEENGETLLNGEVAYDQFDGIMFAG